MRKQNRSQSKGNRGKKQYSASNTERPEAGRVKSRENSPEWYAESPQLLQDSASLPYSWPTGTPLHMGFGKGIFNKIKDNPYTTISNYTIPGVMRIGIVPTVGLSKDDNSPVNIAARNIYSFVRHANSGHANYDAPDLMMYLLAMDSVYSILAFMQRAYGTMRLYSQTNRYYPKAIITAMGLDYDDFMSNMPAFRYFINSYAVKVGSLCVPNSMSYYRRHIWLYSGLYMDSDSPKGQTYLFSPDGFFRFDEVSGAGKLTFVDFFKVGTETKPVLSLSNLINLANSLIDVIIQSEDMNIMSGDILKAYGEGGLFKVSTISEDYTVMPSYEPEVLSQIQNATLVGTPSNMDVTQDPTTGTILFQPCITSGIGTAAGVPALSSAKLLNMYKNDVTPSDTMVASRLMASSALTKNVDGKFDLICIGSDIATRACVFRYRLTDNGMELGKLYFQYENYYSYTANISQSSLQVISAIVDALTKFRFHPLALLCYGVRATDTAAYTVSVDTVLAEINNYAFVSNMNLDRMHDTAMLSEFSCPQMGALK